jgi:mercuric reductase
LEIAMAYNRLGSKVRILEFTDRTLRSQTADISDEIAKHMEAEGIQLYPNYRIRKVEDRDGIKVISGINKRSNEAFEFMESGKIVVATGTIANTAGMGLEEVGVQLDEKGSIMVNRKQETNVENVYAVGDCTNTPAFVYTAAVEGKTAALNAIDNAEVSTDYKGLPWVVFTDPQIAGAGIDETEAESLGIPFETATISLVDVPRAIAALDTSGFIKLIRNPETDELLGIRVVAPEGGELVMQVSLAIKYGIKVGELANSLFPYLTLSEGVKLAAITFHKDVKELSCCAV